MVKFVIGRKADMVWSALLFITIFLPLASLSVDVPEYFRVATLLQGALDASAQQAVNDCLDLEGFSNTGTARLKSACIQQAAGQRFGSETSSLTTGGHSPVLMSVACSNECRSLQVQGVVSTRVFFSLSPRIRIVRTARSDVRMVHG